MITIFGLGCAHHRDVRPGADGVYNVILQTDEVEKGSREAISQANHFCKQRKKEAAEDALGEGYTIHMRFKCQ